jgi:hypothetical protein
MREGGFNFKTVKQESIAHSSRRPMAVKVALILQALTTGESVVMSAIYAQWSNLFLDISFGLFVIVYALPLWFVFHGKNWARWFVAVVTGFDTVFASSLVWFRYHQTFSTLGAVWFWLSYLLGIIAVIALFHPSSNRWFRGSKLAHNTTLEATATTL